MISFSKSLVIISSKSLVIISVSNPNSLNPDPDPVRNLNPDPEDP